MAKGRYGLIGYHIIRDFSDGEYSDKDRVCIGNGVTVIQSKAFSWCTKLKAIVIPESVKRIGDSAFSGCTALELMSVPGEVAARA